MEALMIDPLQRPPPLPGASPPNVYTFTNRDGYSRHTRDNPHDAPRNAQLGNMLTGAAQVQISHLLTRMHDL